VRLQENEWRQKPALIYGPLALDPFIGRGETKDDDQELTTPKVLADQIEKTLRMEKYNGNV